ncbi:hypothetical protein NT03LS_0014a, partial [Listeria seeligeri FSL N1-067]
GLLFTWDMIPIFFSRLYVEIFTSFLSSSLLYSFFANSTLS